MTEEAIQINIRNPYPVFITRLTNTENRLQEIISAYKNENVEFIRQDDFRPGTFGRILSSVVGAKFILKTTLDYFSQENWKENYRNNFMPELCKEQDYFGHIKEIDTDIRFILFHSVYHQIETTLRIICKLLPLKGDKPITLVNNLTNVYPADFIELIDAIRNTIHNNGFYEPLFKSQKPEFDNTFKGKTFYFKQGNRIDLTTEDVLNIVDEEIELIYNVLKYDTISKLPFSPDKV